MTYSWMAVFSIMRRLLVCHWCWQKNLVGNKYTTWKWELKDLVCAEVIPNQKYCGGVLVFPSVISFIFLSCFQISIPASGWWLALPPWIPWCPASVWCPHRSPRKCQLLRRSSTARAAPCSPPTPVSHNIMLILHLLPPPQPSPLPVSPCKRISPQWKASHFVTLLGPWRQLLHKKL